MRQQLARRLRWFLPSRTPKGQDVPALLSPRVILFSLLVPVNVFISAQFHQSIGLTINLVVLAVVIADDIEASRSFHEGMEVGRLELVYEALDVAADAGMGPGEYLLRELVFDREDVDDARRQVRRSARHRDGA